MAKESQLKTKITILIGPDIHKKVKVQTAIEGSNIYEFYEQAIIEKLDKSEKVKKK